MTALAQFFSTENFMPHGTCIFWRPDLLGLYVGADFIIGASYYSIPLALMYFASRRKDLVYRWVLWLFVIFIMACGTTHLVAIWTLWVPEYAIEGLVKAATAVASLITAVTLWWIMPRALAIPSRRDIETVNRELTTQVQERRQAEAHVRELNASLEKRVAERTQELQLLNAHLENEIVERLQIEEEQSRLLAELDHRVRNNMASIVAMARTTLRTDQPVEASIDAFEQRLMAFSQAHSALADAKWRQVSLRTILQAILAPYLDVERRNVQIRGPEVPVGPEVALTIGLVVNEMTTNAAKYGALSAPGGFITVDWHVSCDDGIENLHLGWREAGGLYPSDEPGRGFGTRFIEGSIKHKLHGTAAWRFETHGMAWDITIPLQSTAQAD